MTRISRDSEGPLSSCPLPGSLVPGFRFACPSPRLGRRPSPPPPVRGASGRVLPAGTSRRGPHSARPGEALFGRALPRARGPLFSIRRSYQTEACL